MHHIKPIITKQNGKQRPGKGFSPDEIKEAGLNSGQARTLRIPIDRKRKTSHEENIANLKEHIAKSPVQAKPKQPKAESAKKPKN
jgi:ribosomal protein L13E